MLKHDYDLWNRKNEEKEAVKDHEGDYRSIFCNELRAEIPETYTIPEGKILSPAAREYLQQCKVKILDGRKRACSCTRREGGGGTGPCFEA